MASLHKDAKRSPFWYLRYKDANGKWKSKSTPFRYAIAAETRKARQMEADASAKERAEPRNSPAFKTWVPAWIASRFADPLTRERVGTIWSGIEAFFEERGIRHPMQVERRHAFDFFDWRKGGKSRKAVHHNTALLEVKYLAQILGEAAHRGYITANPIQRLGIKKIAAKEKSALTDEQILALQAEFERMDAESGKPWMARSFKIALCQGVRLRETQVPLADIDLERGIIVFNKTKGKKPFGAPLHPALRSDVEQWLAADEKFTCELPAQAARIFHRTFKRLGIQSSFHATRVTVATRLALGGVDERLAKLYLNHSSSLVHSIYVKLRPEHAAGVTSALIYPKREPSVDKSA